MIFLSLVSRSRLTSEICTKCLTACGDTGHCLKPKKCQMAIHSVVYLGYVVPSKGSAPDLNKVTTFRDFLVPELVVGLASHYRRFLPSFSKVAASLFCLIKTDTTTWSVNWHLTAQTGWGHSPGPHFPAPMLGFS